MFNNKWTATKQSGLKKCGQKESHKKVSGKNSIGVNSAILCLSLMLTACGDDDSEGVDFNKVNEVIIKNQLAWNNAGLIDYGFTLQRTPGDCPTADALPTVDVLVEDSVVKAVTFKSTGEDTSLELGMTIDQVFTEQLRLLNQAPKKFSATKSGSELPQYNADLHYPTSYYVDISSADCDATQVRISDFK